MVTSMIPKKRSYSDREIEEILQSLFEEKKKTRELELRLKSGSLSPEPQPLEDKTAPLLEEIASLKKKQEELKSQAPSNKEAQLERVILFLRNRTDQLDLEKKALLEKLEAMQEAIPSQKMQEEDQEERLAEEAALKAQFETLRKSAIESSGKAAALEKQLKEEQEKAANALRELDKHRLLATQSMQELKEERKKTEEALQAKIAKLEEDSAKIYTVHSDDSHQMEELRRSIDVYKAQIADKQKETDDTFKKLQEQLIAHQELSQFTEEIKLKLQKADEARRSAQESLSSKDNQIESLNAQVANLARSLSDLEEALEQTQSEKTEQESRLRVAQQHLAKKVRETTILSEKNEEYRLKILEMEQTLEQTRSKTLELQTTLDRESQHQKQMADQYQESIKAIEGQGAKWEQKYFEIHQRWQEVESRNKELKRLEDRFNKMQQALSHLSSIMGTSMNMEITSQEPHYKIEELHEVQVIPPTAPCATVQPSLFETAAPQQRFKETLFG